MRTRMALAGVVFLMCSLLAGTIAVSAATMRIVSGKVKVIYPVFGNKGSMTIATNSKIYTIYTGAKTDFHPPRWPMAGDRVRVRYIIDRERYYRAHDVYID